MMVAVTIDDDEVMPDFNLENWEKSVALQSRGENNRARAQSTKRTQKRERARMWHVYAARVLVANQHISFKKPFWHRNASGLFFRGARRSTATS